MKRLFTFAWLIVAVAALTVGCKEKAKTESTTTESTPGGTTTTTDTTTVEKSGENPPPANP